MKSSCIVHPADEPLIIIRQWQVRACDGDKCAAALLSFFEYWHNIKVQQVQQSEARNAVAARHGEPATESTDLWQFHTEAQLTEGLVTLFGPTKIGESLKLLVEKGYISIGKNPNPKLKFDRTRWFLFRPRNVNHWLECDASKTGYRPVESDGTCVESDAPSVANDAPRVRFDAAITETTAETSTENPPKPPQGGTSPKRGKSSPVSLPEAQQVLFDKFWESYPNKVNKQAALKAWADLLPDSQTITAMSAGLRKWKASSQWASRACQHPATWLNARAWEDDPIPAPTAMASHGSATTETYRRREYVG